MAVRNPLVTQAFALAGDRTLPPVAAQANGAVSFNQGWPALYQADPNTDPNARPVERDITNALFWLLTANLQQYQREGVPEFISAADNAGVAVAYPAGVSVLWRATTGDPFHTYVNTVEGNTNAPPHASWVDMSNIAANVLLRSGGTMNPGADILLNTPPQFDNDRSAASTGFVQRALGNYQTAYPIGSGITLTAADVGKNVTLNVGGFVNLPLGSTLIAGASILFGSTAAGRGITAQGSDTINMLSTSVSSVSLDIGDTLLLVWNGTQWVAFGGSAQLQYSNKFASAKTSTGWQKLPSGMLIQWGVIAGPAVGGSSILTFPTVFPTDVLQVFLTPQLSSDSTSTVSSGWQSINTAQVRIRAAGNFSPALSWFAIGY